MIFRRITGNLIILAVLVGADRVGAQFVLADRPVVAAPDDKGADTTAGGVSASMPTNGAPIGNPLWAIPLATLSATRQRPIFSPTRRAPAESAPAVRPVVRMPEKAQPDHPQLALVGTVIGGNEGFGVFVDDTTKNVVRLRAGEDYHGWVLQRVRGREATLEKDNQIKTLSLPRAADEMSKAASRRREQLRGDPP